VVVSDSNTLESRFEEYGESFKSVIKIGLWRRLGSRTGDFDWGVVGINLGEEVSKAVIIQLYK
jgi:hypothetical protein